MASSIRAEFSLDCWSLVLLYFGIKFFTSIIINEFTHIFATRGDWESYVGPVRRKLTKPHDHLSSWWGDAGSYLQSKRVLSSYNKI